MSVNPQVENGYVRIANEIWDEIIRRDFSKRQKDIMQFILRLSYGCNRKVAHIPLLKDFSLCGVTQNHIKDELTHLKNCKVIDWERNDMLFAFNKNYEIWQMQPVKKWDDDRFRELIHINLTSQNRNFPKQELPKKGNEEFPKREIGQASNHWESKDEGVSKDSIKDITTTGDDSFERVRNFYASLHCVLDMPLQDYPVLTKLLNDEINPDLIMSVMKEKHKQGVRTIKYYVEAIHEKHKAIEYQKISRKSDKVLDTRRREIALNKWIQEGNDPNEFVYDAASGY